MFSYGFYDQWNNMQPHLLREKNGKKFYLTSDKIIQSTCWGILCILFGLPYYVMKYGVEITEKIKEWEYEKK